MDDGPQPNRLGGFCWLVRGRSNVSAEVCLIAAVVQHTALLGWQHLANSKSVLALDCCRKDQHMLYRTVPYLAVLVRDQKQMDGSISSVGHRQRTAAAVYRGLEPACQLAVKQKQSCPKWTSRDISRPRKCGRQQGARGREARVESESAE